VAVPALAQPQAFEKITIMKPVRSADPRSMRLQVLPDLKLIAHAVVDRPIKKRALVPQFLL
jgi:hypothetical protein